MERYSRQTLFKPIGVEGQENIKQKHVLLIGAGALGTGNAEALVRAGIGKITIVDRDYVEWSNLQRQQLYTEKDAKERIPKAVAAKKRLQQVNAEVEIEGHISDVTAEYLEEMVKKENIDLMLDATDNFDIRMIMNDVAQKYKIPWIYGACVGSYGISYSIFPGDTPCLQCLLKTVPLGGATCDTVGIIAPAVGMVVAHQTAEALKILTGTNIAAYNRKLISFDLWKNHYVSMNVNKLKSSDCPSCGDARTYPYLTYENQTKTAVLCGRDSVQIRPGSKNASRNLSELKENLSSQSIKVEVNPYLVSFQVEDARLVAFQDGRVLVHGTKDISRAKSLYHRYFG
ncbi:thiazole biosynthesis adenylyltransferase ThiF [Sutcliffiella rhizosphaerae]|uniref:THIF-type NAD/FAD binding fold domain-containing protein n=1 Tax=Sutcliffiella rhizosphaerae TaxID=2880967 RepID=A0ABN8ABK8_9BACI|nr:thiazole biosynthesis adenylyltransferase ThiF [Sutcliffiella rhizosphaerae]CAG9622584.1 hypothetical protein BACCIP111883_03375 [Sutcliffiella rhizosphaerae]